MSNTDRIKRIVELTDELFSLGRHVVLSLDRDDVLTWFQDNERDPPGDERVQEIYEKAAYLLDDWEADHSIILEAVEQVLEDEA